MTSESKLTCVEAARIIIADPTQPQQEKAWGTLHAADKEIAELHQQLQEQNQPRCEVCNGELSACGAMTEDGPEMDCYPCQLLATVAELHQRVEKTKVACAEMTQFINDVQSVITAPSASGKLFDGLRRSGRKHLAYWPKDNPGQPLLDLLDAYLKVGKAAKNVNIAFYDTATGKALANPLIVAHLKEHRDGDL